MQNQPQPQQLAPGQTDGYQQRPDSTELTAQETLEISTPLFIIHNIFQECKCLKGLKFLYAARVVYSTSSYTTDLAHVKSAI